MYTVPVSLSILLFTLLIGRDQSSWKILLKELHNRWSALELYFVKTTRCTTSTELNGTEDQTKSKDRLKQRTME